MSYLVELGDRLVTRWTTKVIFLHLLLCALSIALVISLPFSVWAFVESILLPSLLVKEAEVIDAPLVERYLERWDAETSSYRCHLQQGVLAILHLRPENPAELNSLKIYRHPKVTGRHPDGRLKIVEVPENPDWNTVYEAAAGRSFVSASLRLAGRCLVTALVAYVAVRGYWLIKHGPGKRRYRHR